MTAISLPRLLLRSTTVVKSSLNSNTFIPSITHVFTFVNRRSITHSSCDNRVRYFSSSNDNNKHTTTKSAENHRFANHQSPSPTTFYPLYVHPLSKLVLERLQSKHHLFCVKHGLEYGLTIAKDGSFALQFPNQPPSTRNTISTQYTVMDKKYLLVFHYHDNFSKEEEGGDGLLLDLKDDDNDCHDTARTRSMMRTHSVVLKDSMVPPPYTMWESPTTTSSSQRSFDSSHNDHDNGYPSQTPSQPFVQSSYHRNDDRYCPLAYTIDAFVQKVDSIVRCQKKAATRRI